MLNESLIANIRQSGMVEGEAKAGQRASLLQQLGFQTKEKAEYALIASCFLPSMVPDDMKAFSSLLRHYGIDYTLLHKEYCCGNLLYLQALRSKSDEELQKADILAEEFLEANLNQARRAGASKIIAFCAGCDLVHHRFREESPEEIMWYPTLLERIFSGGRLEIQADYYAGCHYFYQRLNRAMPDLEAVPRIFSRIDGLQVNHLDRQLCCTRPQQMEVLAASIKNRVVITPCGGCAAQLQRSLKDLGDYRVVMVPQVLWAVVSGHSL